MMVMTAMMLALAPQTPVVRAPVAPAPVATPAARAFDAAALALAQRIDRRPANAPMPRAADPAVAPLIAIVGDTANRFGTPDFPIRGLDTFRSVCGATQTLTARYVMLGVTSAELNSPTPGVAGAKVAANSRAYQDAIFPMLRFGVRCNALHIPALEQFAARLTVAELTPQRRQGLAQMRTGIGQIVEGSVAALSQPGIRAANSNAVLRQVAIDAPVLVRVLTLAKRAELGAVVTRLAARAPATIKGDLERLRDALGDRRCTGLCPIA